MLREVGMKGGQSTLVLPQNPGAMSDVANQLRAGFIQRANVHTGAPPVQEIMS